MSTTQENSQRAPRSNVRPLRGRVGRVAYPPGSLRSPRAIHVFPLRGNNALTCKDMNGTDVDELQAFCPWNFSEKVNQSIHVFPLRGNNAMTCKDINGTDVDELQAFCPWNSSEKVNQSIHVFPLRGNNALTCKDVNGTDVDELQAFCPWNSGETVSESRLALGPEARATSHASSENGCQ